MRYLFQNIFICLALGALLGGLIGWILHRLLSGKSLMELENTWRGRISEVEESWRTKLGTLQGQRDKATASLQELETQLETWKAKLASLEGDNVSLRTRFEGVSEKIPVMEASIAQGAATIAKLTSGLKSCAEARALLESQVSEWTKSKNEWEDERAKITAAANAATEEAARTRIDLESRLSKSAADDRTKNGTYEKRLADLTAELQTAKTNAAAAERARSDADGLWRTRFTTLESEKDQFQRRLNDFTAKAESAENGYKARIAELAAQLDRTKADLAGANKSHSDAIASWTSRFGSRPE